MPKSLRTDEPRMLPLGTRHPPEADQHAAVDLAAAHARARRPIGSIDKPTGNDPSRSAFLNAILNSTGDAIIQKTLDGIVTDWSRGAEVIFGYTRAEMIGRPVHHLLPAHWLAEEARIIARVGNGEEIKPFDSVRIQKDGAELHVSVSISPMLDDHGAIVGVTTIARDITERVQMLEALNSRQREFEHMAEAMPHIVWATRSDGWYTYFNRQWLEYTGLTLEESSGHGWNKPFHPEDKQRAWDTWHNAVNNGTTYSLECRLRRVDGAYRWWLVRGVPIFDTNGKISRWLGTCTDIQDLKEAELEIQRARQTLAQSESQFRAAFETAAHGMAIVSIDGRFLEVNQSLCDALGYTEAELLRTRFQDVTHPDDLEPDLHNVRTLLEGNIKNFYREKRYYHKKGRIVWAILSTAVARDSTGIPTHFVSQIIDISHRRAAEQILQDASDLLEAAPDAMIAVGKDGKIRFANGRTEAMFGRTKDDLARQPVDLLIPERLRSSHPGYMSAFFADPKIRSMGAGRALFAQHLDGAEFPIEVSLSPVQINGEELVIAAVRDITARKNLEETLEATRAQMVAAARLSALGEMAGGIAHEINNPLAVIHALASDLVEQGDATPEEILENSRRVVEYADRISKIVRSMRQIARDAAPDPLHEASVGEIVGQTLHLCQDRFRQHSVDLSTSPIDPEIRILCREVQISQTLINLLQNAFDAAKEQEGEKWVRLEVVTQSDRVILSVIDSGKGVPPDLRDRIMEPFFTTKPVGKGTGLGLSLSSQIAAQHGGTLELIDLDGHTCFSMNLPISHQGRAACH